MINTGDERLDETIEQWMQWNKDEEATEEIQNLINAKDLTTLKNLFSKRLQFGTAGLRGRMGPGYSQMNDLVIVQTGQGLVKYLLNTIVDAKNKGVVVGYDGRYNSHRFAELTATILINHGIKVYMYSKICPTPFVAFAVLKYKCAAGIMITASHNPKDDNGYKVYWENGVQIVPPHDKQIQLSISKHLQPLSSSWNTSIIYDSPLYIDPLDKIMQCYFNNIKQNTLYPDINKTTDIKFTYTAMHGVGFDYMTEAFKAANFMPFVSVKEQRDPDPEFPTVKFPNPEEGKSALNLSIKTADENESSIILANDPDADRLACAVKKKTGEWHVFTGNELGALLGWWMLLAFQVRYPDKELSNVYMLASTVSSKILASMAKKEGFVFEETLTGFKWMGNRCVDLIKNGNDVIFAFEEAIGFMCGSNVLDKDGISAAICVAEMAAYLETMQLTLIDKLEEIYKDYGQHISENSYWICHDQDKIRNIFERLRNFDGKPMTYPSSIIGGQYSIIEIRDLTNGYDNTKPDNKATLPISKSSQMITFKFDNGLVTTLRTSGTEPKIKYYTELCASPELQDVDALKTILKQMVDAIVAEFLRPQINGLIARTS